MRQEYELMWKFETTNFRVTWSITPDCDVDTSWDESGETLRKLESGERQCFVSRVRVTYIPSGITMGEDYLGGSIYANPAEFRDHIGARGQYGSYFRDMVSSAIKESRRIVSGMRQIPLKA